MKISFRDLIRLFVFCSLLAICGCTSLPDMVSKEPVPGKRFSSTMVREITVDKPFLLSGDYFRERISEVCLHSGSPLSAVTSDSPALKVGLLIDRKKVAPEHAERLTATASGLTKMLSVALVSPEKIVEFLAHTQCIEKKDLACIGKVLGVYPGVRMLVLIEGFKVTNTIPGLLQVKLNLVDTGLLYRYPVKEIEMPVHKEEDIYAFMSKLMLFSLTEAVEKSRDMPWFCRTFSREEDTWYVNAGKRSGLKPGDILKVVSEGKVVISPSGLPVGWIPGEQKAVLKVDLLFGDDVASCSLIKGQKPTPDDLLIRE